MNCEQANQVDLVEFLNELGHQPRKVKNNDYWYLSPLRSERDPSFKVNKQKNCWYDHGLGVGGKLVDFGVKYFNCSVYEALRKISSFQPQIISESPGKRERINSHKIEGNNTDESLLKVIHAEQPILDFRLRCYLRQRRISEAVANKYCSEVSFELSHRNYTAIGFKNSAGGFELRNEYFKCSSSPKYITYIDNNAENVTVFESFFDFLSYQTIHQNQQGCQSNFLVLNTLSFFERSLLLMEKHERIALYLDHDEAGRRCTALAQKRSAKVQDESTLYKGYKDLNDWMMNIGKGNKQKQSQGRHL